jgi:hypothetical protein
MIYCPLFANASACVPKEWNLASITLGVILFYLSSSICLASTFYIDPSAASNGTGTQASPYNTWAGLKFQPGNTYLQKAGTTYNAELSIVEQIASSGAPIVLDSYGTGAKPIIHNLYFDDISPFYSPRV